MNQLIWLVVYVSLFCLAVYGGHYIIKKYELPQFALWIFGVLLLILLLVFLGNQFGGGSWQLLPNRN